MLGYSKDLLNKLNKWHGYFLTPTLTQEATRILGPDFPSSPDSYPAAHPQNMGVPNGTHFAGQRTQPSGSRRLPRTLNAAPGRRVVRAEGGLNFVIPSATQTRSLANTLQEACSRKSAESGQ